MVSLNFFQFLISSDSKIKMQEAGGVAEWLRSSVSNFLGSARVGLSPVVVTTNHQPTANSAVDPFEVGKCTRR